MNDFLHLAEGGTPGTDGRPIDRHAPIGSPVPCLVIAEAARHAAGLPLVEGARLLIEPALTGTGWAAGTLSGPGPDGWPHTRVSSGPWADRCEQLQWTHGEGPTQDLLRKGSEPEIATDLADEARWPRWTPAARSLNLRTVLTVRLYVGRPVGALTLYAAEPIVVGAGLDLVRTVAAHLSILVDTLDTRHHLERALGTRTEIGQATGILMHRYRISGDQSFQLLRRVSQQQNIKIATLAADLVDHGRFPVPSPDDPDSAVRTENSPPNRSVG